MFMSMKKFLLCLGVGSLFVAVGWAALVYYEELRGVGPAVTRAPADIRELIDRHNQLPPGENDTEFPLTLPDGFKIEVLANNLSGARVIAFDARGNMWVSRTNDGIVTMIDIQEGRAIGQKDIFTGLKKPHGLAFDPASKAEGDLYLAEEGGLSRVAVYRSDARNPENGWYEGMTDLEEVELSLRLYSSIVPGKFLELPTSRAYRNHFSRTIAFGPDKKLYLSIGSSCNVCIEKEDRRAKIFQVDMKVNRETGGYDVALVPYAIGLRNAVFFVWHPETDAMWATEMGRDELGDDLPPDEINIIEAGKDYGWPYCYGKQVVDTVFENVSETREHCAQSTPAYIDLPAHSAPLGLAFIPDSWPEKYRGDLLIAYHGSWNRSEPTGYKITRIKLSESGQYEGEEDFIAGWLTENEKSFGRPVDLKFGPDGALYASDDKAGVAYRVTYEAAERFEPVPAPSDGCRVTGCSGEVCSDEEITTACLFQPEYVCYQTTVCERQANGECGWTETGELSSCLKDPREAKGPAVEMLL